MPFLAPILAWLARQLLFLMGETFLAGIFRTILSIGCGAASFWAALKFIPNLLAFTAVAAALASMPPTMAYMWRITNVSMLLEIIAGVYVYKFLVGLIKETCSQFLATKIGPPAPK